MSSVGSTIIGPAKALSEETERRMRENIELMNALEGFDVIVVCCGNEKQAGYWKSRLDRGKGSILKADTRVIAVFEDWPGGAGNGITLALPTFPSLIRVL